MKKTRKKGSVILLFLVVFMVIVVLAAVFLNIAISYSVVNRIMYATGEGAKVRAQAVDIRLKEQEGEVELFHPTYKDRDERDKDEAFHAAIQQSSGHELLYKPGDLEYEKKLKEADEAAIQAAIDVLNTSLKENVDGNLLVDPKPENFCIDIQPIPAVNEPIVFGCSTQLNGKTYDFDYTYIMTDSQRKFIYEELEVRNAVFFASSIEYRNFIHNGLTSLGLSINPHFKYWEVSFPQVDSCTRAADANCNSGFKGYIVN